MFSIKLLLKIFIKLHQIFVKGVSLSIPISTAKMAKNEYFNSLSTQLSFLTICFNYNIIIF